ncbi:hypothetical protein T459_00942 [Capsicum annuum]|uniref:Uncharacterized protein n=1 Tax=Capsicum annuum TaxID=4072 RepID=A0A2G3AFS5_CAPAN|nr:hypothetical protein T459_00942 [Capsicum annuum]
MLGSLEFELGWTAIPKALLYADGFPVAKDLSHCLYTSFNVHPTLLKLVVWLAFHLMVSRLRWMWLVTTNKTQFIMDTFNSLGYKVYGGKNEPYMCVCFPGRSSWGVFCEILEKAHVVTTPGCDFGPGGEGFVRVEEVKKEREREKIVIKGVKLDGVGSVDCESGRVKIESVNFIQFGSNR